MKNSGARYGGEGPRQQERLGPLQPMAGGDGAANPQAARAAGGNVAPLNLPPNRQHQAIEEHPDACTCCYKLVNWSSLALQCDGCDRWLHKDCLELSNKDFHSLEENASKWLCPTCGLGNIHPSILNSIYHNQSHSSNSTMSIDLTTSPGAPKFTSSPNRPNRRSVQTKTHLKIINVNCQSVWAKRHEFNYMLESSQPDIILGTES